MSLVSASDVRRIIGASSTDLISEDDINNSIKEAESLTERHINAKLYPTEFIDYITGNGSNILMLDRNPVLAIKQLKIDGTSITISGGNVLLNRGSGKVELNAYASPEQPAFSNKPRAVIIKYVHAWLESGSRSTTTTASSSAGTSVSLSVSDSQGFDTRDWIEIYGMDGYKECAQVSSVSTGTIVVDSLLMAHESGSIVRKLETPESILHLIRTLAGVISLSNLIGASYNTVNAYSMGEFTITKNDPYLKWKETLSQLQNNLQGLLKTIYPRPAIF